MMKFYGGALSYNDIKGLTQKEFTMFQEYMAYIQRWETKEGAKENKMLNKQDEIKYNKNKYFDFTEIKNKLKNGN